MHIPDGMLSTQVVAATGAGATGFVAYAVTWTRKHLDQRRIVLMAVLAALVFALQMLNFPVASGTSGHFAGGAAVAILLGPWPAVIVMTTVLLVQAVLFADGGILALGANIVNLGVVGPFVAYSIWRLLSGLRDTRGMRIAGAAVAAWSSVVAAALMVALELWLSGRAPLVLALGSMGAWHALIGVGEAIITAGLVGYMMSVRPDLVGAGEARTDGVRGVAVGLSVLAVAAAGLSFLASSSPDGLEFVYFDEGVGAPFAEMNLLASPFPDYAVPGMTSDRLAGILAGIVGVVVVGALLWAGFTGLRRHREEIPE